MTLRPALVSTAVVLATSFAGTRVLLAATAERPRLAVGVLPEDLRLDGALDEPAWTAAPAIDDLVMVEPRQGDRPTCRTVVKVWT